MVEKKTIKTSQLEEILNHLLTTDPKWGIVGRGDYIKGYTDALLDLKLLLKNYKIGMFDKN